MNPLKGGYYTYRLLKAVVVTTVAFAVLLADCVTGFKKVDQFGRWACVIIGSLGALSTVYYWRKLNGGHDSRNHKHKSHRSQEPQVMHRNPPAVLPPRRDPSVPQSANKHL
jgi:hypothetical protein